MVVGVVMLSKPDPLAPKRRHLTDLLIAYYTAKTQAWLANPGMDVRLSDFERNHNRAEVQSVVAKMPEILLDQLISKYDPEAAVPTYVWLSSVSRIAVPGVMSWRSFLGLVYWPEIGIRSDSRNVNHLYGVRTSFSRTFVHH